MDSILTSIKAMLGIGSDYTQFDTELVIFINSSLSKLAQLGVGPDEGFVITDLTETWDELFGNFTNLEMVKNYIYIDVRLLFDPPGNSFIVDAFKKQQEELAWRITVAYDVNSKKDGSESNDTGRIPGASGQGSAGRRQGSDCGC